MPTTIYRYVMAALLALIAVLGYREASAEVPPCWPLWTTENVTWNFDQVIGAGTWAAWKCPDGKWYYLFAPTVIDDDTAWTMLRRLATSKNTTELWNKYVQRPATAPEFATLKAAADAWIATVK